MKEQGNTGKGVRQKQLYHFLSVDVTHTLKTHLVHVAKTQCQSQKKEAAEYDSYALYGGHGNPWKRWDKAGKIQHTVEAAWKALGY